jgi:hypothetical protein
VILDTRTADDKGHNQGDGGNQEALIGFKEIDVSFRKTGGFTVKEDSTSVFRVHSSGSASMNSLMKIPPAE